MAKHSKGKHGKAKPKAALKFFRNKESQEGMADAVAASDVSEKDAFVVGAHVARAAAGGDAGAHAGVEAHVEADVGANDDASAGAGVSAGADALVDVQADSAPVGDEGQKIQSADPGAFQPATLVVEKKERDKKKIAKRIGIASASVVGAVAVIYLVGVAVFATHFMPNTHISNIDISMKTPEEVQVDFDDKVGGYSFKVKGKGLNIGITSAEAGLAIDSVAMTETISSGQDPWKWPVEVFQERDVTNALTDSLSATKLADVVQAAVDDVNAEAKDSVDAYVAFDEKQNLFDIVPEVQGTKLDYETVLGDILVGAMNLEDQIIITNDSLVTPLVYEDDERLVAACDSANDLIAADISLMMGDSMIAKIGAGEISKWVTITPEFAAVLDEESMIGYVSELSDQLNTIGSQRNFVRADGKEISVSGGDYGWKIDSDELKVMLVDAIKNRTRGNLDVPVLQSGSGFTAVGSRDWGARYVDVDISEQHARLYGDDGSILWESDIVSGNPNEGNSTPQGVWYIKQVAGPTTLIGRPDENGEPEYETEVKFWMPFKGNSVGFHDATWQSSFGGSRYRNGFGSHGCVNLPYSKAEALHGLLKKGDVVVVHG